MTRKKTVKRRDGLAVSLPCRYRKRVVKSAKAYNRNSKAKAMDDEGEQA